MAGMHSWWMASGKDIATTILESLAGCAVEGMFERSECFAVQKQAQHNTCDCGAIDRLA